METEQQTTLPFTCDIYRPTFMEDDYGSHGGTYAKVNAAPIICDWKPTSAAGGAERVVAEQVKSMVSYLITVPELTDVKPRDRVHLLALLDEPQHVFEVKAIIVSACVTKNPVCTLEENT